MSQEAQGQNPLVDFVAQVVGEGPLRIEESLGDGFVRLRVSEAERRQAKHDIRWVEDIAIELLRNARDAGAHTVYLATAREGSQRSLLCIDDGSGVPSTMHEHIFEARVTSKLNTMCMDRWGVHGRGMALYSIRQNACLAQVVASGEGLGSSIEVVSDCTVLPERADQSTWPRMGTDEEGMFSAVRGPHNIVRTVVEFAADVRRECRVYFGTPTEVLATLYDQGCRQLADGYVSTHDNVCTVPVVMRPCLANDAPGLRAAAAQLGIDVSERTCYRIMNGEIKPLETVMRCVEPQRQAGTIDLEKDRRGLKVDPTDLKDFSKSLRRSFNVLADRYYLDLKGEPRVHVARGTITVTYEFDKAD